MNKESVIDLSRLAAELRTKRGDEGLRKVAKEIGDVSAATLSRIEKGNVPDVDTFFRICTWLSKSPQDFMVNPVESRSPLPPSKVIEAHLRADRTLSPKTIDALTRMIELAYQQESVKGDATTS